MLGTQRVFVLFRRIASTRRRDDTGRKIKASFSGRVSLPSFYSQHPILSGFALPLSSLLTLRTTRFLVTTLLEIIKGKTPLKSAFSSSLSTLSRETSVSTFHVIDQHEQIQYGDRKIADR